MRPILAYALTLVVMVSLFSMCVADIGRPTDQAHIAIVRKVYALADEADRLYGLPRERLPGLQLDRIVHDFDALTRCSEWKIEIDVRLINEDLPYVLDVLLPHEYAHLVQCWQGNGRIMDYEIHGKNWSQISVSLGGPAINYTGRTT